MSEFRVPLKDIQFALHHVLDAQPHLQSLRDTPVSLDELDAILGEAARFAENELAPLYASGDAQGCRLEDGEVRAPDGFAAAYKAYCDGGWPSMTGDPEYGGQGLPYLSGLLMEEMMTSANMAWTMYPALSHGAVNALTAHGDAALKETYLRPLLSGQWTGTMCLTEGHAGSDVGLLRTRAEPQADGSYEITGTKIFISAGDHDMAENIVHLVLARLPDAPSGTRGISLFVVPKFLPDAEGGPGERNAVSCGALEEKMGIHGNATCVLNFDGATGFLLGPENQGMRCMFTMMNAARIVVGVQGVGLAERGFQASLGYALERRQMRALSGPVDAHESADTLMVHPDIRRMLLTQKSLTEASRALCYYTAMFADLHEAGSDQSTAERAGKILDFLTPIAKGFCTEVAFESVNHAVQIYGGHGFIRETGVEQLVRDARITLIYEGTTQIQALDLLGRKVILSQGEGMRFLAEEIRTYCQTARASLQNQASDDRLKAMVTSLEDMVRTSGDMATALTQKAMQNPEQVGAASVDFLMYSGYFLAGYMQLRMAVSAALEGGKNGADIADPFLRGKIESACFYFERILPRCDSHLAGINSSVESLMGIDAEEFAHC